MKAFEGWYKQVQYKVPHAKYPLKMWQYYAHRAPHDIGKDVWRAALEWFYDKLDYSQEHEELKDLIEQELEIDK